MNTDSPRNGQIWDLLALIRNALSSLSLLRSTPMLAQHQTILVDFDLGKPAVRETFSNLSYACHRRVSMLICGEDTWVPT